MLVSTLPDALLWFVFGLGHLCLFILLVNVCHGFGVKGHWLERATVAAGLIFALGTCWAGWFLVSHDRSGWGVAWFTYAEVCGWVALVGFPACTLANRRRDAIPGLVLQSETIEKPDGSEQQRFLNETTPRSPLAWRGNQSLSLSLQSWTIERPGLPDSLDGIRILHLSDFHFSPSHSRGYFEWLAEHALAFDPNLVVFTGDLIEHETAYDWVVPVLSRIKGRLGQFAILGNHDRRFDEDRAVAELAKAGFEVLEGSWVRVESGNASIAVGGTSHPWGPRLNLAHKPECDLSIVLSHTPDLFKRMASKRIDLVVAGHNHGGQIRLPLIGAVLMPSRYSRRFDRGFFQLEKTLMHVSQGVGGKYPVRYGCPPQISCLTILTKTRQVSQAEWESRLSTSRNADSAVMCHESR